MEQTWAIEVLGPANKDQHRRDYLAKRSSDVAAGVNVVEIVLFRRGQRTVDVAGHRLRRSFPRSGRVLPGLCEPGRGAGTARDLCLCFEEGLARDPDPASAGSQTSIPDRDRSGDPEGSVGSDRGIDPPGGLFPIEPEPASHDPGGGLQGIHQVAKGLGLGGIERGQAV